MGPGSCSPETREAAGNQRHANLVRHWWYVFGSFHLFVMLLFAMGHGRWLRILPGSLQSFLSAYGYLTGSSSGFLFFAPRVADQPIVEITVHRSDLQYSFTLGAGRAERLRRVSSMLLTFEQGKGYLEGAALFSSYVFAHDQAATIVDVRFCQYVARSLRSNRSVKPFCETLYVASFARSRDYAR